MPAAPPLRGQGWAQALLAAEPERQQAWQSAMRDAAVLCPPPTLVFHAFERGFADVRVVIVGQDPYPGPGHATGLAFAVPSHVNPPPTLRNILRELSADACEHDWYRTASSADAHGDAATDAHSDVATDVPSHAASGTRQATLPPDSDGQVATALSMGVCVGCQGRHALRLTTDLEHWARQGVLLLNTVLTCTEGHTLQHERVGWQAFTRAVLVALSARERPPVAILWGRRAQHIAGDLPWLGVVSSAHPSPLSAHRGFFGSRPFSRANGLLHKAGLSEVTWLGTDDCDE